MDDADKTMLELLDAYRKAGVRRVKLRYFPAEGGKFFSTPEEVEFAPPEPKPLTKADAKAQAAALREAMSDEDELCDCKHSHFMHVNGLCTQGCAPEKCLPAEETKA